ncbi:nucleoside kinase [Brachybacterium hainanense]|uniref:Nucleoside kinase n=1 Tax=Brachybacterium hainanense TaxID=1541174 RepID=A0ABV6RJH8_9MICO
MGRRNHLIDGLSGTGKTTVAEALQRRGHHVIHGDRDLAQRLDPGTGASTATGDFAAPLWDEDAVREIVADASRPVTFFCGGSRNHARLRHLFDEVLVLEVDLAALDRRLDARRDEDWGGDGPPPRELIHRWHRTGETLPPGVRIDAGRPVDEVIREILLRTGTSRLS